MIRMFILMILSMETGIIFLGFLSKTPLNIWISRGIGALVTGLTMAILYKLFIEEKNKNVADPAEEQ